MTPFEANDAATASRKTRIFIADDVESKLNLQNNLQSLGFIADVRRDVDAANRAMNTGYYAIMIHASRPKMCGFKRKVHDTPSIIVRHFQATKSAVVSSSQAQLKKQCLTTGVADILEHPVSKDALYECICSLSATVEKSCPDDVQISSSPSFHEMGFF